MEHLFFLSWVYSDQPQESPNQFVKTRPSTIRNANPHMTMEEIEKYIEKHERDIAIFFNLHLTMGQPTELYNYLDFHYLKFQERNPGLERDFLFFIEENIENFNNLVLQRKDDPNFKIVINEFTEHRRKYIYKWVEEKWNKLKAEDEEMRKIPGFNAEWTEMTKKECISFYKEKEAEIRFKKVNLPHEDFKNYIHENLNKWANNIENWEREKRKMIEGGSWRNEGHKDVDLSTGIISIDNKPSGDSLIQATRFTFQLWQKEFKEFQGEIKEPTPREYITHPQQILLFERLGITKYLKNTHKLTPGMTAKAISFLSNRGLDNTKKYLRYVSFPKDRIPTGEQNYHSLTPENIKSVNKKLSELGLSK